MKRLFYLPALILYLEYSQWVRAIIDFWQNTTDVSNITKGSNDIALNPTFTDPANGDFRIGTNLKAMGFPGVIPGATSTTGYLDIGAVQRQEAGSSGSSGFFIID